MNYFVFYKEGYEDADYNAFERLDELRNFIIDKTDENARCGTGFQIIAVVKGEEMNYTIIKRTTDVSFD